MISPKSKDTLTCLSDYSITNKFTSNPSCSLQTDCVLRRNSKAGYASSDYDRLHIGHPDIGRTGFGSSGPGSPFLRSRLTARIIYGRYLAYVRLETKDSLFIDIARIFRDGASGQGAQGKSSKGLHCLLTWDLSPLQGAPAGDWVFIGGPGTSKVLRWL